MFALFGHSLTFLQLVHTILNVILIQEDCIELNYISLFTEMDDFDLLLIALVNMGALLVQRRRNRINRDRHRRRRRVWVRPINTRRRQQGAFYNLFQEIKTDEQMFHKYTRMTLPTFQHFMDIVNPSLMKRSPRALEPEQRVALTLRYMFGLLVV